MKRILLIVLTYCFVITISNSQETVSPYYTGDFECVTIDDFISSNDIFSMDGEVIKLKDKAALAHLVSDELQQHNLLHPEKFALDYVLIFYPVWYVNHNNEAISGKEAVIYFANTNGCFDNVPSQSNRFYRMLSDDKVDEATKNKMMKWVKEAELTTFPELEDPLMWRWFYVEVEYKISISSDVFGNKKAVLTRELPQYFLINYKDEQSHIDIK